MFEKLREKLILRKIHEYHKIEGWLSDNEALGLYHIAHKLPRNAVVVEIGSWKGKSTYCISKGLKSGKIYAIDPFNADAGLDVGSQKEYTDNKGVEDLLVNFNNTMKRFGVHKKIVVKKGYSTQFHKDFNRIDFLFIDGDHSIEGCKTDFDLYSPKIVSGGFIAFHDFYEKRDELGPTHVIKKFILKSTNFKFFRQYDTLWIAKRQ
ncbi:class I SAM-dependent methyltransferase [Parapedobacter tibetensis]|uniref:class I SAM-dependent methyltransferase n=1 Tax=Parapedobacter tibetensis TaxID=2972951 RepID=UPI00214DB3F1|nr:class I SAM-dependent methyltransferase [Parapedobacter tibetensis]